MTSCTSAKKASLSDLPSEILVQICSHLDFRSLISVGNTCKTLQDISLDESLWKSLCSTDYLATETKNGTQTWLELYHWYHHRIGQYHCPSVYRTMRRLWDRMERYLENNDPEILASLRDPCDICEILIAEEQMKCPFPPDLRCSLLIHNGQQMRLGIGLVGCMTIASYFRSEGLLDAAFMARHCEPLWGALPGCVPITYCYSSRRCQYIGVEEYAGFTVGEVFYPVQDCAQNVDIFITARSYREWFTDLVVKLENKMFPRIDNLVYRFEHEPGTVARSHDCFSVKVSTCFMPELSGVNPPQFQHIYRITMSMDKDADPSLSCQLMTRHWIITDMDGDEERVDGEGVVGEFPIMRPGAEHSWISSTSFSTTHGNMRGSFTMKNLLSNEEMEIECPIFHMKCLPYKQASDRKQLMLNMKKNL